MNASVTAADARGLAGFLQEVHGALQGAGFPLALAGAPGARAAAAAAAAQLDDYILPRLQSLDAPLLAVIGGSTGAGKSTLVNGLIGRPVTRTGAVRPTTRHPILLHHPADAEWFTSQRVLPSLSRVQAGSGELASQEAGGASGTLLLQGDPSVPRGLAILDAPDIDSIADENRRLAGQLLAAADLWLFVTTANRYADAVPWKLLTEAARRDILLAVVLDRVPAGVEEEVRGDLMTLLAAESLGHAPIFVVPESQLDPAGMLPAGSVDPVRRWLQALAADAEGRADVARRTLAGAVRSLAGRVEEVADAAQAQQSAAARLAGAAGASYQEALTAILRSTEDGTMLRGEVLARWQDFIGTGEFMRGVETRVGWLRDRITAFFTGQPAPATTVAAAIETGLHSVIVEESAKAFERTEEWWRSDDAGRALLAGRASYVSDEFSAEAARQVREWQQDLLDLVSTEGSDKRFAARMLSFGVNGVAVALMVVVFASTGGLTGAEIGIAGGSAVVGQKLLEAVFGEDAVRRLAKTARDNLERRCRALLDAEQEKFTMLLAPVSQQTPPETLFAHARRLAGTALTVAGSPDTAPGGSR
jgi:hypothetical protein